MSATSVGTIGLDLVVNRDGFDSQMQNVGQIAKKAGTALAAAFSVKKLADFGKKCIELGSDLSEVQNVVDVTFPKMTEKVDEFAKSAATSFGLSETMAKQYTGTFGAMAKAFGFTEKQAYDMGTTLTGLAGDVASFYNLTQDEAYTKLKSVFTGETESLKDLGVVMTQTALDSYALANGWGKTTQSMSEAEKVALRYAFVQKQLSAAQGDFARTSGGWANQVRILKLQVDSIMASIGQGLINLLTPVIKLINTTIGRIATLANAFRAFTELLTGNKSSPGQGIEETAEAAEGLETAAGGVGSAAEKAAKKLKGLMGFDKLNNIQSDDSGSGGAAGGSNIDFGALAKDADEAADAERKVNPLLEKTTRQLKELGNLLKSGFKAGLGRDFELSLKRTKGHLKSIKDSLIDIFTDKKVTDSAKKCASKIAYALGQTAGAALSVGQTITENITGGIDKYLKQNSGYIKERLIGIFDATGEIAALTGDFAEAFAGVFEVFRSDTAKQCTADIIGIFSNAFLGIYQLGLEVGRDVLNCIVKPFIDNQDKIKEALTNTLKPIGRVLSVLNTSIGETFEKIFQVYDEKIRPAFEGIAEGLSALLAVILDTYNQYIAPVLDELAINFTEVWQEHIQPVIDKAVELFGKFADCISVVWQNVLVPFSNWITSTIVPVLAPVFEALGKTVLRVFGAIADTVGGFMDILGGILDFITGVFTGDWDKCWEGFVSVVNGAKDMLAGMSEQIIEIVGAVPRAVSSLIGSMVENADVQWKKIRENFLNSAEAIKNTLEGLKNIVVYIFRTMWITLKSIINSILGGIEKMVNGVVKGINGVIRTLNGLKFDIPEWIPGMGGKSFRLNIGEMKGVSIPRLAKGGIVRTPTLAMMGENSKKEAVVPLDRNLEWRDAIVDKIIEKMGAQGGFGGGLTAAEVRSIMMEAVNMFAQLISQMEIKAVMSSREAYKGVMKEYKIENKPKGRTVI